MRKRQGHLAVLVCLVIAASASAAFVQVNEVQVHPYQYSMISNNLIQSGSATLVNQYDSTLMQPTLGGTIGYGELPNLNDGVISAAIPASRTDIVLMDELDDHETSGPPPYQVFELDTTASPLGYDLTEVAVVASFTATWNDTQGTPDPPTDSNSRAWQNWEIKYNLVGEAYAGSGELNHTLGAIEGFYDDYGLGWRTTKVSLTDDTGTLISGVSALQIKYIGNGQEGNGYVEGHNLTAYSEVMMAGVPSTASTAAFGSDIGGTTLEHCDRVEQLERGRWRGCRLRQR